MFHRLSLQFIRLLLHIDHFKMLLPLLLQTISLIPVSIGMVCLVGVDVHLLFFSPLQIQMRELLSLILTLRIEFILLVAILLITHANLHNVLSLLCGLFDFFPRLYRIVAHSYS